MHLVTIKHKARLHLAAECPSLAAPLYPRVGGVASSGVCVHCSSLPPLLLSAVLGLYTHFLSSRSFLNSLRLPSSLSSFSRAISPAPTLSLHLQTNQLFKVRSNHNTQHALKKFFLAHNVLNRTLEPFSSLKSLDEAVRFLNSSPCVLFQTASTSFNKQSQ